MGKQGPCRHCGVTSTPLWRNGPPDKPVLCNACGSRWRTKGSLVNYTPMHARDDIDIEEPRVSKLKPPTSKLMEQKQLKKRPSHGMMEIEPFSDQNFRKMGDADLSNRTSSGSAISYSESCAPYGTADASEMTGSAQSHAWESLIPSRKRSCVTRPKPSPVEKLVKDLNSIMHEEQLHYLSGSSEEDLLYHSETPLGSFEIGYGSVLLRHPSSKSVEEESEASSIPVDNKSYITSESYSGSVSFGVHSESMGASNLYAAAEKPKRSQGHIQEDARRDKLHYEKKNILEDVDSPLVSIDLKDVINYNNFVKYLTKEEQQQLIKFVPPIDSLKPPESLRSMFTSTQFADAMHSYQKLLGEGVLDPTLSVGEKWKPVRRLAFTTLTKCKWLECYEEIKGEDTNTTGGKEKTSLPKDLNKFTMKPLKRSHETQLESYAELKGAMSAKRACKFGALAQSKCSFLPKSGNPSKDVAPTGGFNLLMLPPDKLSMLAPLQYVDNESDQDLLLDIPLNARHAEAELLCQPCQLSSVTRSSTSEGAITDGKGRIKQSSSQFR